MKYFLFPLLFFCSLITLAGKSDSLIKIVKENRQDSNTVKALNSIAWKLITENKLDSSVILANRAIEISNKINYKKGLASAYQKLAVIEYYRSNLPASVINYNISLKISTEINDISGIVASYNNLGILYHRQGNLPKALDYALRSLKIREKTNDEQGMGDAYNNIGLIYKEQKDYPKALGYYFRSVELKNKLKDSAGLATTFNNIGTVYDNLRDYPKALNFHFKTLAINSAIKDEDGIGGCLNNIGMVYYNRFQFDSSSKFFKNPTQIDSALFYFRKALTILKKAQDLPAISDVFINISMIFNQMGDYRKGIQYADSALVIALEHGITENLLTIYGNLAKSYFKLNDFKNAYLNETLFKQVTDSMFNIENSKQLSDLKINFEVEKKEAELNVIAKAEQEKLKEIAAVDQQKRNLIILSVIIVLILVLVFSFFLYKRYKITNSQKILIEHQRNEVQEAKNIIEENQKEILDSIHYANRIQNALMTDQNLIKENLPESFILFKPKDIVSGDFYWACEADQRSLQGQPAFQRFYLAICDSTGHGVPGAFMSLLNIGFLNEAVKEKNIQKPNEIFNYVRTKLIESISSEGQKDGMDGILICYDPKTKKIEYSAANNEPILIRDGKIIELEKDKMPVGKGEKNNPFMNHEIHLKKGDCLYLYTDGFADQFGGEKGKKFKYKALNELLLTIHKESSEIQKQKLDAVFNAWRGELQQVDDVLVAGIRFD